MVGDARAGTPSEAAKEADAVLLAVHWSRIDEALKQAIAQVREYAEKHGFHAAVQWRDSGKAIP